MSAAKELSIGAGALVDSHCHLDFDTFEPELDEIVARARRAGLVRMVTICTRVKQFQRIRAVADRYPDIFCTIGTHPHNAGEEGELGVEASELAAIAKDDPLVVGIGECGLDYFYDHAPREAQAEGFRQHLSAAAETGLPIIVHARDADQDVADILEEAYAKAPFTGLLHCFSSGRELAERAVALGMSISLSGILTFKKSEEIRDIVRDVPMDRLLVETDAPYLAPPPHRGKRNEPAYVVHTNRVLAEVKGVSEAEMAAATTANFFRLFSKVPEGELVAA